MSIKIENMIKIATDGSYLLLTPEEYQELLHKPVYTVLKDIQWNGPMPELAKDQRIAELEKELKEADDYVQKVRNAYNNHEVIRDKQKAEIEKLRAEVTEIGKQYVEENEDNFELLMDLKEADDLIEEQKERVKKLEEEVELDDKMIEELTKSDNLNADTIKELRADLEAMTLKAKGMVEKKVWRDFPDYTVANDPELQTDHGTAEVLRELLQEGDIEPVEPTPPHEPEAIAEHTPEPETVPEPEVSAEKYPAKKKGFGVPAKNPFTEEQKEKYIALMGTKIPRKDIISVMAKESDITLGNAASRYYALLQSITADQAIKELDERTKMPEPVKPVLNPVNPVPTPTKTVPAPIKRISSLPEDILKQLDALPKYPSAMQFKNQLCKMPDMSQYSVAQLKVAYKETHKNLTW